jgi:hypothetical protein
MDFRATERREFLLVLGYAVLAVHVLPLTACDSTPEAAPPDNLTVTSSSNSKLGAWAAHSHLLHVPLRLLRTPPRGGVTLSTTRKFFHSHEVTLTEAQLLTVARGETVEVAASGGAHTFAIQWAHDDASAAHPRAAL